MLLLVLNLFSVVFFTVAVGCRNRNKHPVVDLEVALLGEASVGHQLDDNLDILEARVVDIVLEVALIHSRPAADDNHVVDNHYPVEVVHNLGVVAHHRVAVELLVEADID